MECNEVSFIVNSATRFAKDYPSCSNGGENGYVAVHARYAADSYPEQIGAAFRLTFGMGLWIALFLHVIGVEIYVSSPFYLHPIGIIHLHTDTTASPDTRRICKTQTSCI